jgi:beta-mannosidase
MVSHPTSEIRSWLTQFIAFDDQTSTFIIPSGAGFEVIFCPGARSTKILTTNRDEMLALSQREVADQQTAMSLKRSRSGMFRRSAAAGTVRPEWAMLAATLAMTAVASLPFFW